jgi:hypothetical protein
MIRRGDVVIVDFPFTDTGQSKFRPAQRFAVYERTEPNS